MNYNPKLNPNFGTIEDDEFHMDWLAGPTTSSDRDLLAGWVRCRIETLREKRALADMTAQRDEKEAGRINMLRLIVIGAVWSRELTSDWDRYQAMAYVIDDALEALAALGDE